MPNVAENNKDVKRSKAEVAVYGLTNVLLFFLLLVSFFLALLSPYMDGGFLSYLFLLSPVLVIIALIGVGFSNKNRSKILKQTQENIANGILPPEKKLKNYGLRLLMMFGVVVLGGITLIIIFSLISAGISSVTDGTFWDGNFWMNVFPLLIMLIIAGIGAFSVFKLIQLLRK